MTANRRRSINFLRTFAIIVVDEYDDDDEDVITVLDDKLVDEFEQSDVVVEVVVIEGIDDDRMDVNGFAAVDDCGGSGGGTFGELVVVAIGIFIGSRGFCFLRSAGVMIIYPRAFFVSLRIKNTVRSKLIHGETSVTCRSVACFRPFC